LKAYIFKIPEPIAITFGTLQSRFIPNTSVDYKCTEFITQSGATWRKSVTLVSHSTINRFGITCLAEQIAE